MAAPVILGVKAWANYTSAGSGASTTVTNTGTTVSGRGLLALIGGQATNNTPNFSDSKGNTWTKIASLQNGTDAAAMYLCGSPTNVGTSHSFTVNWTDGYSSVAVLELDQAVALDNWSTATDSGTPWDGTLTTLSADCLVVTSTTVYATSGSWALAASGWTWYGQLPVPADASDWDIGLLHKTSATATANAISTTGTDVDGATPHHLIMASLKAAGGSSDTGVTPAQAAVVLSGPAPTLVRTANQAVSPAADALVVTGLEPTLAQTNGATFTPAAAEIALTGRFPTVAQTANQVVQPAPATLAVAGPVPAIVQATGSVTVIPGAISIAITGYAPDVVNSGDTPSTRNSGFEMSGGRRIREVRIKPLLQAALESRLPEPEPEELAPPLAANGLSAGIQALQNEQLTPELVERLAQQWRPAAAIAPNARQDAQLQYLRALMAEKQAQEAQAAQLDEQRRRAKAKADDEEAIARAVALLF